MTIRIGSNIASLTAQRRLGEADASLSKTFERLSSGQRINRASDDAAGLAIADDLKAKGRIYTQGIRNGNDGISLLNIADSAIDALSGIVTRIRELSEQAANGTYSNEQRAALDAEAQALSKEFTRITQTTSFNGIKLFDGSLGSGVRLQLGVGLAESINASVGGAVGTGDFEVTNSFVTATGSGNAGSFAVSLGDLNGDGILDLVTAGYGLVGGAPQGQASVLLGNSDGSFQNAHLFTTETGSSSARSYAVTLGDVNGDGILDIVTAGYKASYYNYTSYLEGQASVLLGNGDGTFQTAISFTTDTGISIGASYDVALGDLNGDGILDLITTGSTNSSGSNQGQASVLLGNGDGTFRAATSFTTDTGINAGSSSALSLGDLNGDGILDLITAGYADNSGSRQGQTSVLLGNGDGTFQATISFSTETGIGNGINNDVTPGDLNGDGILDLVTVGSLNAQGRMSVLLGNGDGSFQNAVSFTTDIGINVGSSNALSLGDLNGDGILDLATAGYAHNGFAYQSQATVLLGIGDGSFQNAVSFTTDTGSAFERSLDVALGDLNGDGILDLVTAGNADYKGRTGVLLARTKDGLGAILEFSIKTKSEALQSMGMLDRTLENLAKQRGTIGTSQSRVNIAISNLQTAKENFAAAESRIRDADIAAEAANLVRTQILQQAAASVLSQANQQPNLALQLLN